VGDSLTPDKRDVGPAGPPPPPVPERPLLRLVEAWKAEVRGAAVLKAAHTGEVRVPSIVFLVICWPFLLGTVCFHIHNQLYTCVVQARLVWLVWHSKNAVGMDWLVTVMHLTLC
jgi:hypothetical protein